MNLSDTAVPAETARRNTRDTIATAIAAFGLLASTALAFSPAVIATPADKLTLLFLAVAALICFWTPLLRIFDEQPSAAAFALTVGMFLIYSLARNAGPKDGSVLQFSAIPDEKFPVTHAAKIVVLCAFITIPAWLRQLNGWLKAVVSGAILLALLAAGSLYFLGGRLKVGVVEEVDPTYLPIVVMQLVEYSCVALLCTVVTANPVARKVALRFLPFALLALWGRHYFMAAPVKEDVE